MKRILALLLSVCVVFCLVACGSTPTNTDGPKTQSQRGTNDDHEISEKDTTGMYYISETDSWILIPKEYTLFTREMDESSAALKGMGLSKDDLVAYLDGYGSEFVAITPDGNMEVMLKFKKTDFSSRDLSSQSESTISSYAKGLQVGFGAKDYELIENNGMIWIKLAYSHSVLGDSQSADYVRYTTIKNGWDVSLWGASYEGTLTSKDLQELQNILESFFFIK